MLPSRCTASPLMIAGCAPGAITTAVCCASGAVGDWRLHPETITSTAKAAATASACEWPRAITLRPGEPANMTASQRGGQDRRTRAGGRPHGDMEGGTGGENVRLPDQPSWQMACVTRHISIASLA